MATITKIEQQKNKARVNIFVDDAFFCGLNKETAIIFKFKVGQEVDENQLTQAIFESETKKAFEKASDYLATRMHSEKELFDKLIKKGYTKDVANKAIEKLEEYHYIDDELFAKQFIDQNKKLSKKMLENKLFAKGVNSSIIKEQLQGIFDEDELNLCISQVQKYIKSKDMTRENSKEKLYASLLRKGFPFEIIKKATKIVINDDEIEF